MIKCKSAGVRETDKGQEREAKPNKVCKVDLERVKQGSKRLQLKEEVRLKE